jgi:hypothetical protein
MRCLVDCQFPATATALLKFNIFDCSYAADVVYLMKLLKIVFCFSQVYHQPLMLSKEMPYRYLPLEFQNTVLLAFLSTSLFLFSVQQLN